MAQMSCSVPDPYQASRAPLEGIQGCHAPGGQKWQSRWPARCRSYRRASAFRFHTLFASDDVLWKGTIRISLILCLRKSLVNVLRRCVCMCVCALTGPTLVGNQDVLGGFRAGILSKHSTRHRNLACPPILALGHYFLLTYKNKLRPTFRRRSTIKPHNRETFYTTLLFNILPVLYLYGDGRHAFCAFFCDVCVCVGA